MNRIASGIPGLDSLIEGGFPQNRTVLVSGGCGTGKTIFALQFLYNGALKSKEPGIYVTLDERPDLVREDCMRFGWDLKKLEKQGLLEIIDATVAKIGLPSEEEFAMPATGYDIDKLLIEIMRAVKRIGAKRVVIDSIPSLGFNFESEGDVRNAILKLSYILTRAEVTSVLISELDDEKLKFGKYGVEEYVSDGVIVLHFLSAAAESNRTLFIRKMRSTKHSEDLHPVKITDKGIEIKKAEDAYKV